MPNNCWRCKERSSLLVEIIYTDDRGNIYYRYLDGPRHPFRLSKGEFLLKFER